MIALDGIRFRYDSPDRWGMDLAGASAGGIGSDGARRHLLAHAIRVERSIFPGVAGAIEQSAERLRLPSHPTAFIINHPEANAACVPWSSHEEEGFSIVLNSGLVSLLDQEELGFVVAHEIGHFLYRHHRYPQADAEENFGRKLAILNLQRSAEISADRLGVVGAKSFEVACSAMVKSACGLGEPHLRFHLPSVLAQFRDLTGATGGYAGAVFETHPMLAIRIRAILRFSGSDAYRRIASGGPLGGCEDLVPIDEGIRKDFDKASGFAHETWEDERLGTLRLWAVLLLFAEDLYLSKEEQALLEECFGSEKAKGAIGFVKGSGGEAPTAIRRKLAAARAEAVGVSETKLESLFGELERLAAATSSTSEATEGLLRELATLLGLRRVPRIVPWEPNLQE